MVTTPDQYAAICGGCVTFIAKGIFDGTTAPARANWPYGSMGEYVEEGV